jgi:hypothetical protein
MRVHISDDGLRSLIDMDMLHSDVLVTTVAKAAIGLELVSECPHKPSNSRSKSNGAIFRPYARA